MPPEGLMAGPADPAAWRVPGLLAAVAARSRPDYDARMARNKTEQQDKDDATGDTGAEYTVEELSRLTDTTVRNIRAYQDRGVLPPPERRGRRGIYSDVHRARLKLINDLLERGYSIANIAELLAAQAEGRSLDGLLGISTAVGSPWTDETPGYFSVPQLVKLFGKAPDPLSLAKAARLGVLVPDGKRFKAYSPRMVHAGAELVKNGVPFSELLDIVMMLRDNVERVAELFVMVVDRRIFGQWDDNALPPDDKLPAITDMIWKLRPLAGVAVNAEFARAIEKAADRHLGDRVADILDRMREHEAVEDAD